MRILHVVLLCIVLFGAGTVAGAWIQHTRDSQRPASPSRCFLVYNSTLPEQLRVLLPGIGGSQRYEVYSC